MKAVQPPESISTMQKPIRFEPKLPIDKIQPNPLNPRMVFREKDINDLCNSIIEMGGIIVPLVVFEVSPGSFVLLDGERRLKAAKKLGMKDVPANIVSGHLSGPENLSTMFNIHMAREPWDPASRAIALRQLKEFYEGISRERLAEITGMTKAAIRDAERILCFPEDIIERCLLEGKPDYLRPSNLIAMEKAFEVIEKHSPNFFVDYNKEKVMRVFVEKRDRNVIPRNTDFRLVKEMFAYLPTDQARGLIEKVLEEPGLGISDVYELVEDKISSKRFDLFQKSCNRFLSTTRNFKFEALDKRTAVKAKSLLKAIRDLIDQKIRSLGS